MSRRIHKGALVAKDVFQCLDSLGVTVANPAAIQLYVERHAGLAELVAQIATDVRGACLDLPLALELVRDPEDAEMVTLVLYLRPQRLTSTDFDQARAWNDRIAERMANSDAWFIVNVDLRGNN